MTACSVHGVHSGLPQSLVKLVHKFMFATAIYSNCTRICSSPSCFFVIFSQYMMFPTNVSTTHIALSLLIWFSTLYNAICEKTILMYENCKIT